MQTGMAKSTGYVLLSLVSLDYYYSICGQNCFVLCGIIIIISPLFTSFEGDKPDPPGNISMGGTAKRK